MSEADEIAETLIVKHGQPSLPTLDAACSWIRSIWADVDEWIGRQMLHSVAESLMRRAA